MLSDKIKEYSTRDKMLGTGSNNFYQDIVMHWPEYHQYQLKMAALSLVHISQMESIMKLLPHRFSVTSLLCITLFVFTAYLWHWGWDPQARVCPGGFCILSQCQCSFPRMQLLQQQHQQKSSQSDSVWTFGLIYGQLKRNFISSTKLQQVFGLCMEGWVHVAGVILSVLLCFWKYCARSC